MSSNRNSVTEEDAFYIFNCPHCDGLVCVKKDEIACKMFRHGVMINPPVPVSPHLPKDECEELIKANNVRGCCKPFLFVDESEKYVTTCDYI